ncbi:MAG: GNAT family N-acetyltransferase [Pseudomonadota bacterium]
MIQISTFRPQQAEDLVEVFSEAVTTLTRAVYSDAQVEAWLANTPDVEETRARCADGRLTLVAQTEAGRVVAFVDLEDDGHIDLLYARPEIARSGVTTALYAELEEAARARGIDRLFVEASETARFFFEKQGFTTLHRRDFEIHGVAIHNYAMEKHLAAG